MKKKKRVLNIVFVYLYLMYIGATFPVKAQSNYKVKLTGIVYEYDQNNKLLPLKAFLRGGFLLSRHLMRK